MKMLKLIPILCALILYVFVMATFLSGCTPAVVEEVSMGVTEGIVYEIEEYAHHKNQNK